MTTDTTPEDSPSGTPLRAPSTDQLGPLPARWYCVSRDGLATLCKDEADARENAAEADISWPRQAPHRAVLLGDVDAERARAPSWWKCDTHGPAKAGAWGCPECVRAMREEIDELRAQVEAWRRQCDRLTRQVICCGVAASHPDATLTTRGAYAGKWNSAQAEEVRKLRAERDALKAGKALTPKFRRPTRRLGRRQTQQGGPPWRVACNDQFGWG